MERIYGFALNTLTGLPAPGATITVYDGGTLNPATIYADNILTPKANPFTADLTNAYWFFYAASGRYDVKVTKAGNPDYTLGDVVVGAIFSLNGLSADTQLLAVGSTGTAPNWVSAGSTHTLHLPLAAAGVTSGLVSNGAQTIAGLKTFSTPIAHGSGGTGLSATPANGQLLIGNGAAYVLANLTGTANQITVTNGAGTITLSLPQNIHSGASPTFLGMTLSGLTANAFLYSGAGGALTSTAAPTNGQLLIGSTGAAPVAANLLAGANITIVNGAGSITISAAGGITSINGLAGPAITIVVGSSGTDVAISAAASTITLNVPNASATARGVISSGTQTIGGQKTFNKVPRFNPGISGSTMVGDSVGGILASTTTAATSGTGEDTLTPFAGISDFLKANTLDGWQEWTGLRFTMGGTILGTAGTKTFRLYVGALAVVVTTALAAATTGNWHMEVMVVRVDAANVKAFGFILAGADQRSQPLNSGGSIAVDLTADKEIKLTGECSAAGDTIFLDGIYIEYLSAP